jgi:hypothetical protein
VKIISKIESDFLNQTGMTFVNIQNNPEIAAALADQGYGDTRIQEGLALHSEAETSFRLLVSKRQTHKAEGENMRLAFEAAYKEYMANVSRLRKELAEDLAMRLELRLEGIRSRPISACIEEMNHFYNRTLNDAEVAAKILPMGFTPEKLQVGLNLLAEYLVQRTLYKQLTGELQKLAVEKDKSMKRLRRWMAALTAACKVAFADNLQTLEEIGFFVRNRPKAKSTDSQAADSETPQETTGEPGTDTVTDSGSGV